MVAIREKIAKSPKLSADYDMGADVLYIALGALRPAEGEDAPRGIVYRFDMETNEPCGVTVVGFVRNGWGNEMTELSKIVARHLKIDYVPVLMTIERTMKR
jgi:hypothetical protein